MQLLLYPFKLTIWLLYKSSIELDLVAKSVLFASAVLINIVKLILYNGSLSYAHHYDSDEVIILI